MAAILDLPEVRARVHQWTVADYVELAEDNPAFRHSELIRGVIVEKMSKTPLHVSLTRECYDYFAPRVRAELLVRQEGPLRLADSAPEPDVAVVRGAKKDFWTSHPTTAELVVEVAVSSVVLDREKASLYAEAGVTEYWIVFAEAEMVEVYRRPENGIYQEVLTYRCSEVIPCACVESGTASVATWFA